MEFGAEFYVLVAFIVFVCLLGYLGAHRFILSGLDARGQAIADELAQAAKLRAEATALLASFEQKTREAEAEAAQIVADARAQAERLAVEAAESMSEFVARRTKQAEAKIALAETRPPPTCSPSPRTSPPRPPKSFCAPRPAARPARSWRRAKSPRSRIG